jgi:hypothetical protein
MQQAQCIFHQLERVCFIIIPRKCGESWLELNRQIQVPESSRLRDKKPLQKKLSRNQQTKEASAQIISPTHP